jgi:hypothetical protein
MLSRIAHRGMTMAIMIVMLAASNAIAHHSFAPHFDTRRRVDISGTVKEYEARNPHSYLHVNAVDENGRTREYVCGAASESHRSCLKWGQKSTLPVPCRDTARTCVSSRRSSWRMAAAST